MTCTVPLSDVDNLYGSLFATVDSEQDADDIELYFPKHSSGLMVFDAKLFGNDVTILLDYGSTNDHIDYNYCVSRGFQMTPSQSRKTIKMVNNTELVSNYIVKDALFRFQGFKEKRDLHVLDLKGAFQVILGQPFLRKVNPKIDWRNRTMTISRQHDKNLGTGGVQTRIL